MFNQPTAVTTLVIGLSFASAAVGQDMIFFDDFTGPTGADLSGLSPSTTYGPSWIASPIFDADGAIAASDRGSATLAFTPTDGNVYTLDASFRGMVLGSGAGSPENDWFAVGFGAGQTTGSGTGDRFINTNLIGKSWSLVRGHTGSDASNQAFLGSASSGTADGSAWSGLTSDFGGDMDLRIVLDTTSGPGSWTSSWYARRPTDSLYTEVRGATTLLDSNINSVGIAKSGPGVSGSISSFSLTGPIPSPPPPPPAPEPTSAYAAFSSIGTGYATAQTNATSFSRDSVATFGDQQFVAYYDPVADGGTVVVARRTIGSDTWTLSPTSFVATNIHDPHDNVGVAIDGDGIMHITWGHHNHNLRYATSTAPVTTPGAQIVFTNNLGPSGMTGNETRLTYPEFVDLPGGDVLFFYRNGGSGNGDLHLNRYHADTDTWSRVNSPLLDGTASGDPSSSNAYWHTPIVDSTGRLHLTWSYRWNTNGVTPFTGFQTNHDIYYAYSDDEGATWRASDGTPYTAAITQSTSDLVVPIAQGSSLINQASMAVDNSDRPVIATWWAPEAGIGNHVRQYMLAWDTGAGWQTSQITGFTDDYDNGNTPIPESQLGNHRMSRPVVLVDEDDRVLVLFTDERMGNTLMMAHSEDRTSWDFLELDDTVLGKWEPMYDPVRWETDGIISMLFQPSGLGDAAETVSLFEFDARGYFADLNLVLGDLNGDGLLTNADISAMVMALTDPTAYTAAYPDLDPDRLGDFTGDDMLTNGDIAGFVDALTGGGGSLSTTQSAVLAAVPEPSSLALLGIGGLMIARRRRG